MAIGPGTVLDGRFRIGERIGRGGMAEVWTAVDLGSGAEVALKLLDISGLDDPDLTPRFEREARAATRIASPFVCRVLGTGRHASAEEEALYIVLERLHGETIAQRLERRGALPLAEMSVWFCELLQGVAAAHAVRVVHRDLKPSNVFLAIEHAGSGPAIAPDGTGETTKILDFGVSKIVPGGASGFGEPSLTRKDATLGSFAYMAPEQVAGAAAVDGRADLYAASLVAFRALTGTVPFAGHSVEAMLALKVDQDAPTLAEATGHVWPEPLERFFGATLARAREDRPDTAGRVLDLWRAAVERGGAPVLDVQEPIATPEGTSTTTLPRKRG